MNKQRSLLLLASLLLAVLSTMAAPRSKSQAKAIADKQALRLGIAITNDGTVLKKAAPLRVKKKAGVQTAEVNAESYYVFENGDDRGYTIVSGDDLLPEIVGYTTRGCFDEKELPDGLTYLLRSYEELAEQVVAGNPHALRTIREAEALKASSYSQPVVKPLLGDIQWDQGKPYNRFAPVINYGEGNDPMPCATGCVATAMAQVMMYHRWPDVLKADIDGYNTVSYGFAVSGETAGAPIDWDNMLPKYKDKFYTQEQADAVGKLMSYCGKAVKMNYGPSSGAKVRPYHMTRYFGYDQELVQEIDRFAVSLDKWVKILDAELLAKRPVLYSGQTSDVGHMFVCDGSDGTGLYHINWGWGGYQDGYFDVSILNPEKGGIGSGNAPDGFNRKCQILIGLQKDNGVVDKPLAEVPAIAVQRWNDDNYMRWSTTRANASEPFTCDIRMIFANVSGHDLNNVLVSFALKNADGQLEPMDMSYICQANIRGNEGAYAVRVNHPLDYVFPVGRHTVYAVYSLDNGDTWQKCRHDFGPLTLDVTETTLTEVKPDITATLSAEVVYIGRDNTFNVTVHNNTGEEYCNLMRVFINTEKVMPESQNSDFWVTVPAGGSATRTFSFYQSMEDIYVWVKTPQDKGDAVIIDGQKITGQEAGVPKLTLVKVESNAAPDAWETERAYVGENCVKVPRVDDDKLVVKYTVRNDGERYYGRAYVKFRTINKDQEQKQTFNEWYEGGGALKTFTATLDKDRFDEAFVFSEFTVDDNDGPLSLEGSPNNYYLVDGSGRWYPNPMNQCWFYLSGKPTAIVSAKTDAADGLTVEGGVGQITIAASKAQRVDVFSLAGQRVASRSVAAGATVAVNVPSGLYVVKGKKIVVR